MMQRSLFTSFALLTAVQIANMVHGEFIRAPKEYHPRSKPNPDQRRHLETSDELREICSTPVNRLKTSGFDFNEYLAKADSNPDLTYTDDTFEWPTALHRPELRLVSGQVSLANDAEELDWLRIKDAYSNSEYSMFGPDDEAYYEQALQGELGNCWLVVAAASIAEEPDRIHDIVEIDVKNSVGIYATSMYLLGMPITVIVDDYLPIEPMDNSQLRYAQVPEDGALWGPILEKTFAKYLGNYEAIDAGVASHGIEALLGSPFINLEHA